MAEDTVVSAESLKAAEMAVREAVGKHGPSHPDVLTCLETFIGLLHKSGNSAQAQKMEERAKQIRQMLGAAAPVQAAPVQAAPVQASPAPAQAAPEPAASSADSSAYPNERHLYNSMGEHVATEYEGNIYLPEGRHLGWWNDGLSVYLDRKGYYLGEIVDDDRFARNQMFQFSHMNFGESKEGDRAGWGKRPDTNRTTLPRGYDDVKIGAPEQ
jgi:hypothetical protein